MANYDSDIELTVDLTPGDVVSTAKEINESIQKIFEKTKGKGASTSFKSMEVSMDKLLNKSTKLQTALETLGNQVFDTEEFKAVNGEIDKIRTNITKLQGKKIDLDFGSVREFKDSYAELSKQIEIASTRIKELKDEQAKLIQDSTYVSGIKTPEYKKLIGNLEEAKSKYAELKETVNSASGTEYETQLNQLSQLAERIDTLTEKQNEMLAAGTAFKTGIKAERFVDIQNIEKDIDETTQKFNELSESRDKLEAEFNTKTKPIYDDLTSQISQLTTKLEELKTKQNEMMTSGEASKTGDTTEEYQKLLEQLNQVNNQLTVYKQKSAEATNIDFSAADSALERIKSKWATFIGTIRDWAQETNGLNFFSGIASGAASAISSINSIHVKILQLSAGATQLLGTGIGKALQGIGSLAKTAFSGLISATKTAIGHVNNLRISLTNLISTKITSGLSTIKNSITSIGKSSKSSRTGLNLGFKTFLRYGLGIRSVYTLVNKLRKALFDGFKNLAKVDSEFNTSLSKITSSLEWIKNSFAAAFAPIVEAVAPLVERMAEKLVNVIRISGQFLASITGKNVQEAQYVYTDYAESLDKSSKSTSKLNSKTKELKKTLAGFDDVEILKDNKETEEPEKLTYSFEPGNIDASVSDLIDKLKDKFLGLFDVIKQAWNQNGGKLIESFKNALQAIKDLILNIADTFYRVFTEGYGFTWLTTVFNLLGTILDIITTIATTFSQAWSDNGRGYNYIASIFNIFICINNLLHDIGQAFIDAWNSGSGYALVCAILEAFTNINNMIATIAIALRNAWNDNGTGYELIKSILDLFTEIFEIIGDIAQDFAVAFRSPQGQAMLTLLFQLLTTINKLLRIIARAFKNAWNDNNAGYIYIMSLFGLFSRIFKLLKSIADAFIAAWDDGGRGQKLISHILNLFTRINITLSTIATAFTNAWNDEGRGQKIIGRILDLLTHVTSILETITTDFGKAFNSTAGQDMLTSLLDSLDAIVETLDTIAISFEDAWNDEGKGLSLIVAHLDFLTSINALLGTIAESFKKAWQDNGAGQKILEKLLGLVTKIHTNLTIVNTSFTNAFASENGQKAIGSILSLLDEVISTLSSVADSFEIAWNDDNQGQEYIDSIFTTLTSINDMLGTVGESFRNAWVDENNGAVIIARILSTFKDINSTITSASDAFKVAWEDDGHGEQLVTDIYNAFEGIVRIIGTVSTDFGKMLDSTNGRTAIGEILTALDEIVTSISGVETAFDAAWDDDDTGLTYVTSISDVISGINRLLGDIYSSFTDAWLEGSRGELIIQNVIVEATNLNEAIVGWVTSIQEAWTEGERGVKIWQDVLTPIQTIQGYVTDVTEDLATWAAGLDFGPLMESFDGVLESLNPVAELVGGALKTAYEEVLLPLGSWTIEEALPTILDTLASTITTLTTALDAFNAVFSPFWENILKPVAETVGDALITVITSLNGLLSDLGTWMSENTEIVEKFVEVISAFALAWLGVQGVGAAITVITNVGTALGTLAACFDPVTAGIVLVIGAGIYLIQHWEEVKQAAINLKNKLSKKFDELKVAVTEKFDALKEAVQPLLDKFEELKTGATEKFEDIKTGVSSRWEDLKKNIDSIKDTVATAKENFNEIKTSVSSAIGAAKNSVSRKWEAIKTDMATKGYEMVLGAVKNFNSIKNNAKTKFESMKITVSSRWEDIKKNISSIKDTVKTAKTSFNDMKQQLSSAFKIMKQHASKKFDDIKQSITTNLSSAATTGKQKMKELKNSITTRITTAATNVATKALEITASLDFSQTVEDVKTTFLELPGKIKEGIGSLTDIGKDIITDILTGLGEKVQELYDWFNNLGTLINTWIKDAVAGVVNIPGKISDWVAGKISGAGDAIATMIGSFASGGFPTKGQLFFARENGTPEMVGKLGGTTTVANNQQIVEGIRAGVLSAMQSVAQNFNHLGGSVDLSGDSLAQLYRLNNTLTSLTKYSTPLIAQGKLLPTKFGMPGDVSKNLDEIRNALELQSLTSIDREDLRALLIDIATNYISSSFYLGDEQLARHANKGNIKLTRMYGTT